MSSVFVPIGSAIATEAPSPSSLGAKPRHKLETLGELLEHLERIPSRSLPMLRTTASHLAAFHQKQISDISIADLVNRREQFRLFLEARKYAQKSVRSYLNFLRILTLAVADLGWKYEDLVPRAWLPVLRLAPKRKCTNTVRDLAKIQNSPGDITERDVEQWVELSVQQGVSFHLARKKKSSFWCLLRELGYTKHLPAMMLRAKTYRLAFDDFPADLKAEVTLLLNWKLANFVVDRPQGAKLRPVSAKILRAEICQILGFWINVRGGSNINSLAELVRKDVISDFITWRINDRGVKGDTLRKHLGSLFAAMRQHPTYSGLDLGWVKKILESLPNEPASARKERKAKKYLDYSLLLSIPSKIDAQRPTASRKGDGDVAELAMQALLIEWLVVLAWRQQNLRTCRINGEHPNLFKASIPVFMPIDKPEWVQREEKINPSAEFWQFHFTPEETKTGIEARAVLPQRLVGRLENYLTTYRPTLVNHSDPGTLLVSPEGGIMTLDSVTSLVSELTLRYGGRRVTPHLFRDILAYSWLKEHPNNYLTLSKLFWHKNPKHVIETYGVRFNVSSGVCAMEAWLEEREAKSK